MYVCICLSMLWVYPMKYDSQCSESNAMKWLTLLKLNPEDSVSRRRQREGQSHQLETAQQREERLLRRRVRGVLVNLQNSKTLDWRLWGPKEENTWPMKPQNRETSDWKLCAHNEEITWPMKLQNTESHGYSTGDEENSISRKKDYYRSNWWTSR